MSATFTLLDGLTAADALYMGGAWAQAVSMFESIACADPGWAAQQSLPLMVAHCRIELELDSDVDRLGGKSVAPFDNDRGRHIAQHLRLCAIQRCRTGE